MKQSKNGKHRNLTTKIALFTAFVLMLGFGVAGCYPIARTPSASPATLVIQEQGSFTAGGTVTRSEGDFDVLNHWTSGGQALHGDHASVIYQVPENARNLPLVFLHGAGQSSKSWETTADGRDGFQNIFLRRGFGVYLVDQPRRGTAGQTTVTEEINTTPSDQTWFTQFRIGLWPDFYEGVQFPQDEESLNQFFRQMTPNTGPYDEDVISDAMAAVFEKSGPGILITHSQGGGPGWQTAMKSDQVRAVVAYEPAAFPFPTDELPEGFPPEAGISAEDFEKLTRIPIVMYYRDYIPDAPSGVPSEDFWLRSLETARRWAVLLNRQGGDTTVVHLPEEGIQGNTHFLFSDLNNVQVADLFSAWMKEKGLDTSQ